MQDGLKPFYTYAVAVQEQDAERALELIGALIRENDSPDAADRQDKAVPEKSGAVIFRRAAMILAALAILGAGVFFSRHLDSLAYTQKRQPVKSDQPSGQKTAENLAEQKPPPAAEELFICRVRSPEGLRLREAPSVNSKRLDVAADGEKLSVYEVSHEIVEIDAYFGLWFKVSYNGVYGWVFSGFTSVIPAHAETENDLAVNNANISGTWFSDTTDSHDPFFTVDWSDFCLQLGENGSYISGKYETDLCDTGSYELSGKKMIVKLLDYQIEDEEERLSAVEIEKYTILELKPTVLVLKNDFTGHTARYTCFPQKDAELKRLPFVGWMRHINKYGNASYLHNISLLMYAIYLHRTDVALALINSGADVFQTDDFGRTALHYAAFVADDAETASVVKSLQREGLNLNQLHPNDETPFDITFQNGN